MRAHEFIVEKKTKAEWDWDKAEPLDPNTASDVDLEKSHIDQQLKHKLEIALDSLTPRERKVLTLYYGLFGEDEHTYNQIGKMFDVADTRILMIAKKAIRKLKNPSRARILKPFIN